MISNEIKARIVAEYEQTGETAKYFAKKYGISESGANHFLDKVIQNIKSGVKLEKIIQESQYNPELELL